MFSTEKNGHHFVLVKTTFSCSWELLRQADMGSV